MKFFFVFPFLKYLSARKQKSIVWKDSVLCETSYTLASPPFTFFTSCLNQIQKNKKQKKKTHQYWNVHICGPLRGQNIWACLYLWGDFFPVSSPFHPSTHSVYDSEMPCVSARVAANKTVLFLMYLLHHVVR